MEQQKIIRSAIIMGNYRYELRRSWGGGRTLAVIGLNPSTADSTKDDATIRVLTNYAKRLHFSGLLMLNLYAWRATRPCDLFAAAGRGENVIGTENTFDHLKARINHMDIPYVWAAWGNHGANRGKDFCRFMGKDFVQHTLKAFAVNKDGSPHHPLRVKLTDSIHPYLVAW